MKILYAEDTQDLNRAVTTVLTMSGYDVTSVFDGVEALKALEHDSFDAAVFDIMMPGMSGIEVLEKMRAMSIFTPVLLLTAKSEVDDRVAGLDAGADDYLVKPFAMKELLARIRSLTRRSADYSDETLSFGDFTLKPDTFELSALSTVRLSVKEFELLRALMLRGGEGADTQALLGRVWRDSPEAGDDTVFLYVSYLRGKLKAVGSSAVIDGSRGGAFTLKNE